MWDVSESVKHCRLTHFQRKTMGNQISGMQKNKQKNIHGPETHFFKSWHFNLRATFLERCIMHKTLQKDVSTTVKDIHQCMFL